MRLTPWLALLLVAPALAGCLAPADNGGGESLHEQEAPGGGSGSSGGAKGGGKTAAATGEWKWAPLEDAKIRPGVQVVSPTGQCTSNFVFTDARDVYLGIAAHCVEGMKIGDPVDIGGSASGTLVYSSWITMEAVDEKDEAARAYNDFALVRIDPQHRSLVHPAMRHFGGPTALADSAEAGTLDKVLTYGNSGLRGELDPASWHEGYVTFRPDPWTSEVYTVTPGVPGDSGSGVLTGDGQALGVLVTLTIAPTAGSNGVTSLDLALAYAAENAGIHAELATWDLLDPGLLPGA